jgi:hypothetical protein
MRSSQERVAQATVGFGAPFDGVAANEQIFGKKLRVPIEGVGPRLAFEGSGIAFVHDSRVFVPHGGPIVHPFEAVR